MIVSVGSKVKIEKNWKGLIFVELKRLLDNLTGKKYGCCEGCHKMADLRRVKVSSYAGFPSYKYLCKTCESLERLKKYWWSFLIRRGRL